MAMQYNFNEEDSSTILVQQNQVWIQENSAEQDQTQYSDAIDATLTEETANSYVDDENNHTNNSDTHYFSILDSTNDMDLNDITQTALGQINVEENVNQNQMSDVSGQEIVLFRVDGSEDLYGLQVAQDEEGNLQKFQFKVRQNDDGNFEAIPETVQLSPLDCDFSQIIEQQNTATEIIDVPFKDNEFVKTCSTDDKTSILIKQEKINQNNDAEADESTEDQLNTSTVIENFKQERENVEENVTENEEEEETIQEHLLNLKTEMDDSDDRDIGSDDDNIEHIFVKDGTILDDTTCKAIKFSEDSDEIAQSSQEEYEDEEITFEEDYDDEEDDDEEQYTELDDSDEEEDIEEYHVINGEDNLVIPDTQMEGRILKVQKQPELIQEQNQQHGKINLVKNPNRKVLVLKSITEKENVSHNIKTNPRSILKSSQPYLKKTVETKPVVHDERFEKRFAKSKEAIRARLFQSFIAQTKIIQAPVRTERLPRKQVIQPVTRTDEEIIVQEVYVPSNGYHNNEVENKKTKISETIQLSDSDEDYDPRKSNNNNQIRRKRKRRSLIEIVITDTSTSEVTDVESDNIVDVSFSDSDIEKIIVGKKKRGRPSKKSQMKEIEGSEETELPVKRGRGRPPKIRNVDDKSKVDHKCTKCTKTFPSLSSLNMHLQYHNSKESNCKLTAVSSSLLPNKCVVCNKSFKDFALLMKHKNTIHREKEVCGICKMTFSDKIQLTAHKRSHMKEQMFKSTVNIDVITPMKMKKKTMRSVVPSPANQFKCRYCYKILPSQWLLRSHVKNNHERFKCKFCSESFVSKYILDDHVRRKCVKIQVESSPIKNKMESPKNGNRKRTFSQMKPIHPLPKVPISNVRKSPIERSLRLTRNSSSATASHLIRRSRADFKINRNVSEFRRKTVHSNK